MNTKTQTPESNHIGSRYEFDGTYSKELVTVVAYNPDLDQVIFDNGDIEDVCELSGDLYELVS